MTFDLGSISSANQAQYRSLFARIDGNGDGKVTRDEFVSGAPSGVGGDVAGTLFDTLDQQKAGALSESDLASAFQQLSIVAQSLLIQLQSGNFGSTAGSANGGGPGSELFSKLDANGDGTVTRDEFVAGKPDNVSEDQAGKLYDSIAGANTDGLTQQQLIDGLQSQRPGPGHHRDPSELFSSLDGNNDGTLTRDEFVAGRPQNVSADQAGTLFDQLAGDNTDGLTQDQFVSAVQTRQEAQGAGAGVGASGQTSESSQYFSPLDTNKDGVVSYSEFIAGRPANVSTEQAGAFFDKLTGDGPDRATLAKFTQASTDQGSTDRGADGSAAASSTSAETGQLVEQLLAALGTNNNTDGGANGRASSQPLDVFLRAIEAYRSAALTTAA